MSSDLDFAALDSAVNDLISRTSDDNSTIDDREKVVDSEAQEFPHTAGELAKKFADAKPASDDNDGASESKNLGDDNTQRVETISSQEADSTDSGDANFEPVKHFRGRYMDIVPPPTNAKPVKKPEKITESPADIGNSSAHDDSTEPVETIKSINSEIASVIEAKTDKHPKTEKNRFFFQAKPKDAAKEDASSLDENTTVKDEYVSPFLPDANQKISKRPLGFATDFISPDSETELPANDNESSTKNSLSADNFITKFIDDQQNGRAAMITATGNIAREAKSADNNTAENPSPGILAIANETRSAKNDPTNAPSVFSAAPTLPAAGKVQISPAYPARRKSSAIIWGVVLFLCVIFGIAIGVGLYAMNIFR